MGTKNNPGDFDCYANAQPDEPMFVLLARDERAPDIVRAWAARRAADYGIIGGHPFALAFDEKNTEALACADAMEAWRSSRTPVPATEEE